MSELTAKRIIKLFELAFRRYRLRRRGVSPWVIWPLQRRIETNANTDQLVEALQQCKHPRIRSLISYTLGRRQETEAVPALIKFLEPVMNYKG